LAQSRRRNSTKRELSPKMMLIVVWNAKIFHLIDVLRKGNNFNTGHYISLIISPLSEILAPYQDDLRRHFTIHIDNARPRCVKMVPLFLYHNSLRRAFLFLYSSDMTPSDFWLFRYLKGMLQESSFDESDELLSSI
jgi:hypothetical protein